MNLPKMNRRLRRGVWLTTALAISALAALLAGCSAPAAVSRTGFFFGTVVQLTIYTQDQQAGDRILDDVMARFDEIEQRLSVTVAGSDIDRLNDGSGQPVAVSDETRRVLKRALYFAELSGGAFDPTIYPLVALWGIGTEAAHIPSDGEIAAARSLIDYRKVTVDDAAGAVTLGPDQGVDLGGIAKGYAADEARRILLDAGIEWALLNLGGNILTMGSKPDGSPWKIGVQDPFGALNEFIGVAEVTDRTLVTSGVYERYFMENAKRYHHILDPATGFPADNGLVSATIITDISMDADALSTAVFVLGLEDGMALAESLQDVEAIFITEDKKIYMTENLAESFRLTDDSYTIEKR